MKDALYLADMNWCKETITALVARIAELEKERDLHAEGSLDYLSRWNAALLELSRERELRQVDSFDLLVVEAKSEARKAMTKFPQPNYVITKIAEESGEVVKAAIHFLEGRDTADHVRAEMRQTIAMLYRLWTEGDGVHKCPAIDAAIQASKQEK